MILYRDFARHARKSFDRADASQKGRAAGFVLSQLSLLALVIATGLSASAPLIVHAQDGDGGGAAVQDAPSEAQERSPEEQQRYNFEEAMGNFQSEFGQFPGRPRSFESQQVYQQEVSNDAMQRLLGMSATADSMAMFRAREEMWEQTRVHMEHLGWNFEAEFNLPLRGSVERRQRAYDEAKAAHDIEAHLQHLVAQFRRSLAMTEALGVMGPPDASEFATRAESAAAHRAYFNELIERLEAVPIENLEVAFPRTFDVEQVVRDFEMHVHRFRLEHETFLALYENPAQDRDLSELLDSLEESNRRARTHHENMMRGIHHRTLGDRAANERTMEVIANLETMGSLLMRQIDQIVESSRQAEPTTTESGRREYRNVQPGIFKAYEAYEIWQEFRLLVTQSKELHDAWGFEFRDTAAYSLERTVARMERDLLDLEIMLRGPDALVPRIEQSYRHALRLLNENRSLDEIIANRAAIEGEARAEYYRALEAVAPRLGRAKVSGEARGGMAETTFFFSADVIKFYMAVAVVEFVKCARSKDPTTCLAFKESLKDPKTYIGFTIFVLGSHAYSHTIGKILMKNIQDKGVFRKFVRWFGGSLGMGVGSIASDLFHSLVDQPSFQLLLKTHKIKDKAVRWELRQQLMSQWSQETIRSGEWWFEKIPTIASLIAAAGLNGILTKVWRDGGFKVIAAGTDRLAEGSTRVAKWFRKPRGGMFVPSETGGAILTMDQWRNVKRAEAAGNAVQFRAPVGSAFRIAGGAADLTATGADNMSHFFRGYKSAAVQGFKATMKGGKLVGAPTMIGFFGLQVVETTLFLFLAEETNILNEWWRLDTVEDSKRDAIEALDRMLQDLPAILEMQRAFGQEDRAIGLLTAHIHAVQRAFDDYRSFLMEDILGFQSRIRAELEHWDGKWARIADHYAFFVNGMDRKSDQWVKNDTAIRVHPELEDWELDKRPWHAVDLNEHDREFFTYGGSSDEFRAYLKGFFCGPLDQGWYRVEEQSVFDDIYDGVANWFDIYTDPFDLVHLMEPYRVWPEEDSDQYCGFTREAREEALDYYHTLGIPDRALGVPRPELEIGLFHKRQEALITARVDPNQKAELEKRLKEVRDSNVRLPYVHRRREIVEQYYDLMVDKVREVVMETGEYHEADAISHQRSILDSIRHERAMWRSYNFNYGNTYGLDQFSQALRETDIKFQTFDEFADFVLNTRHDVRRNLLPRQEDWIDMPGTAEYSVGQQHWEYQTEEEREREDAKVWNLIMDELYGLYVNPSSMSAQEWDIFAGAHPDRADPPHKFDSTEEDSEESGDSR